MGLRQLIYDSDGRSLPPWLNTLIGVVCALICLGAVVMVGIAIALTIWYSP